MPEPIVVKLTELEYYKLTALYERVQLQQMDFQKRLNEAMAVRDAYYAELQLRYATLPPQPQQMGMNDQTFEITVASTNGLPG